MALKRVADRQLTADNWDEEDEQPDPDEITGKFTPANPQILANRKIRTALRRRQDPTHQNQEKKGIFSGFSGFSKTTTSNSVPSFNFISNLANKSIDNSKKDTFNLFNKSATAPILDSNAKKTDDAQEEKDKTSFTKSTNVSNAPIENPILKKNDEYYTNLKSLNISVSEWIKSHVDKNPYCLLTPIFDDYINHLKELEKLKQNVKSDESIPPKEKNLFANDNKTEQNKNKNEISNNSDDANKNNFDSPKNSPSLLFNKPASSPPTSTFSIPPNSESSKINSPPNMFGQGFSSTPISKAPMFSFGQKPDVVTSTPFSFGTGKPFTFGNMTSKPAESAPPPQTEEENDEDEPPTVTFTPVVEEDNVFSKRCKVFVKKDSNFADRGVGTLYLKPIKDSEKYQLIVRADTCLGNLLINIVLTDIPMQRMGKNNVMLMCIPTPDMTAPVSTLLRVKSAEEADDLLETLNKYKK